MLIGETKDFETRFNFDNVDSVKVSLVDWDGVPDGSDMDFSLDDWSKDETNLFILLGALIMVFG